MGFAPKEREVMEVVGYAAAFSPEQIVRAFTSEYDHIEVSEENSVITYHHSESVYKIEVKITKLAEEV